MSVTEIKEAVMKLSGEELTDLLKWLDEFSESLWDKQIKEDLESGKLDHLIKQARQEFREGKCREIWFFVTWYGSIGGHKSTKSLSGKRFN